MPLPILLLRKRKLRHSLGRPSRSDFVQLEVVDFTGLFLANIGALLKISSLKLVYYITKNKEQEEILKWLSEKRVEVIQNNEER